MKKKSIFKKIFVTMLCVMTLFSVVDTTYAAEIRKQNMSEDEFLLSTGMSKEAIENMDSDFKEYIVNSLKQNTVGESVEYIETEIVSTVQSRSTEVLTGITFTAQAWQSGGVIHIYPTYEFTTAKRPRGKDGFAFAFGDAIDSYEYGGQMWQKDINGTNWITAGSMTANHQGLIGAGYSGSQLGNASSNVYAKGCAYAKAKAGSGTSKKIVMQYMHNPNKYSFSIGLSYIASFGFNSQSTVYTAASTQYLTY